MKDLNNAVQEAIEKMNNDGTIQKMVEDQAKSMVQGLVRDAFSYNSEMHKKVKGAIASAIDIDLNRVDFTQHNHAMITAIANSFKEEMLTNQVSNMREKIQGFFGKPERMEYTITEFVDCICEHIKNSSVYDTDEDTEVKASVESGICGYNLEIQVGERWGSDKIEHISLVIGRDERKGVGKIWLIHEPTLTLGQGGGLEGWLYECYAHGVVVTGCAEFNPNACDLTVWEDEYDY